MADLCVASPAELGVTVVDGVAAATVRSRALVRMGLRTGKLGEFAPPPAKPFTGPLARFSR